MALLRKSLARWHHKQDFFSNLLGRRQRDQNAVTNHLDRLRTTLADRYAIEREFGAGKMATVYLLGDRREPQRDPEHVAD